MKTCNECDCAVRNGDVWECHRRAPHPGVVNAPQGLEVTMPRTPVFWPEIKPEAPGCAEIVPKDQAANPSSPLRKPASFRPLKP